MSPLFYINCYAKFHPTGIISPNSERPDTIRSIVASLVGDGESGDSLVDENEPIHPLQQPEVEDYTDPNWEPEPIDAGPGEYHALKPHQVYG